MNDMLFIIRSLTECEDETWMSGFWLRQYGRSSSPSGLYEKFTRPSH